MCGICLGIGDGLLLVTACLVLGSDLLAQLALTSRGGRFRRLQLVARGIGFGRHGLVRALCVGDRGLSLLDGLLGCGKRVLKVGGDARDIFFGFTQGICRVGDLHRELAGAYRIVGGICRGIALQLGILMTQRLELGARGVDGLLCGRNAGVSLGLHLVADALGILKTSNEAVAGLARARLAGLHGVERGLQAEFSRVILCLHLFELALELCRLGGVGITVNLSGRCSLLGRGNRLALVGDDLVVAACDILARLEFLGLIGNALLKFGQVGAGVGKCLFRGVHLTHGRGALGDKGAHGVRSVRDSGPQIAARGGGMRGGRASGVGSIRIGSLRRGDIAGTALDHRKACCVRIDRVGANRGVLELQKRGHGAALVGDRSLAGHEGRGRLGGLLFLGVHVGIGDGVFHRFDSIHHGVHDGIELFFRRHLDGARRLWCGFRVRFGMAQLRLLAFVMLNSIVCVCCLIRTGVRICTGVRIGGGVDAGRSIAVVDGAC